MLVWFLCKIYHTWYFTKWEISHVIFSMLKVSHLIIFFVKRLSHDSFIGEQFQRMSRLFDFFTKYTTHDIFSKWDISHVIFSILKISHDILFFVKRLYDFLIGEKYNRMLRLFDFFTNVTHMIFFKVRNITRDFFYMKSITCNSLLGEKTVQWFLNSRKIWQNVTIAWFFYKMYHTSYFSKWEIAYVIFFMKRIIRYSFLRENTLSWFFSKRKMSQNVFSCIKSITHDEKLYFLYEKFYYPVF